MLAAAVPLQRSARRSARRAAARAIRRRAAAADQSCPAALVGASLLALLFAGGVLFVFASVLSLRIRRLRDAAETAMHKSGKMDNAALPLIDARDELGDLARSFSRLLDEVAAYTDYLRTLASKLSHELQTPLAIVKSSLDNLDHQAVSADARILSDSCAWRRRTPRRDRARDERGQPHGARDRRRRSARISISPRWCAAASSPIARCSHRGARQRLARCRSRSCTVRPS